jgi:hypothetical protein
VLRNLSSRKDFQSLDMEGFWRHSLCVGVAAKVLAKKRGVDPKTRRGLFRGGPPPRHRQDRLNAVFASEYVLAVTSSDRERVSLYVAEDASSASTTWSPAR